MSKVDYLTARTSGATKGDTDDLQNILNALKDEQIEAKTKLDKLAEGCNSRFSSIEYQLLVIIALLVYIAFIAG